MKFRNLLAEIIRLGITQNELSVLTGILPEKLSKKVAGKIDFTIGECKKNRDVINPDLKLEYLFYQELA